MSNIYLEVRLNSWWGKKRKNSSWLHAVVAYGVAVFSFGPKDAYSPEQNKSPVIHRILAPYKEFGEDVLLCKPACEGYLLILVSLWLLHVQDSTFSESSAAVSMTYF